jgi:hypothetical protein
VEDMCYERRRAEACVDESVHPLGTKSLVQNKNLVVQINLNLLVQINSMVLRWLIIPAKTCPAKTCTAKTSAQHQCIYAAQRRLTGHGRHFSTAMEKTLRELNTAPPERRLPDAAHSSAHEAAADHQSCGMSLRTTSRQVYH